MSKRDLITGQYTCDYCGATIPFGTGVHNGNIKIKERFCSPRCKMNWNNQNSTNPNSTKRKGVVGFIKEELKDEEKTPEQIRMEEEERRIEEEREQQKKEERRIRATELKSEGKPVSAFLTQYGENLGYTSGISSFISLILLFPAFDNNILGFYLVGFGIPGLFLIAWIYLLVKHLKEYFRKK